MRRVSETVLHYSAVLDSTDAHGNPVKRWDEVGKPVGIYAFAPGGESEPIGAGHERLLSTPTIYVPESVIFHPLDRIEVRGTLYEVEGETARWWHPSGRKPGNVVKLRKVTG